VGRQWRWLAFFHLKNRQAENRFKSVFTADCFLSLGKAKSYWRAGGINAAVSCNPLYSRFLYDWRWARYGARPNLAWKNSASRFLNLDSQEEMDGVARIGQILPQTASSPKG